MLKIGIIGQGRSGRNIHAKALHRPNVSEQFEIAAVCDLIPERCKETCEENPGCKAYTDYHAMLKEMNFDLVINATPNEQHPKVTIDILNAGFNCVCEKPMAYTAADADAMLETAKKNGKFFTVFQEAHYSPAFRRLMDVIKSGKLGRIVMAKVYFDCFGRRWDWQTLQCKEAGELSNTGPHPLDQALEIYGDADPEHVVCFMDRANSFGDADDHVKLLLAGKGHPTIDFEVSRCSAYTPFVYQLFGTNGGLTGGHDALKWKYFDPAEAPKQKVVFEPLPNRAYCGEPIRFYEESWTAAEIIIFPPFTSALYKSW